MKSIRPLPNPVRLLKSYFLAGMLVLIPFGVIGWILLALFEAIWRLHGLLPRGWMPPDVAQDQAFFMLINVAFTFGVLVTAAFGISILGWASKHFFGRKTIEFFGDIINHIPVIRSVYSALDQLLRTIAADGGQQFSRVVYVEYPRRGMWTLAFVTGPARAFPAPERHLNVYVPTTPNPTSGFFLIVPESDVRESNLRVEEAFKNILSLGIAQGEPNPVPATALAGEKGE
jgi:uncharacterized membrane protein